MYHLLGTPSELFRKLNLKPSSRFTVEHIPHRNITAQHILKTHRLCRELHDITFVLLRGTTLVLNGGYAVFSLKTVYSYSRSRPSELNSVAFSAYAKPRRGHRHSPCYDGISPFFTEIRIMNVSVHDIAVCCAEIVSPLLFDMYQRPLSAAEHEMLYARKHQIVFFIVHYTKS